MGNSGSIMMSLQILVAVLAFYGIPLLLLRWFILRLRQSGAEHREIIDRLVRLEAKIDQVLRPSEPGVRPPRLTASLWTPGLVAPSIPSTTVSIATSRTSRPTP